MTEFKNSEAERLWAELERSERYRAMVVAEAGRSAREIVSWLRSPEGYSENVYMIADEIEKRWGGGKPASLSFDDLQSINVARCESPDNGFNQKLDEWSILEWAGAMSGEAGEATNVAKKMRRKRIQRGDDKATAELLGEELADTVCYAVLTAARAGIDLGEAVVAKFNKVSQEIGSTFRLVGKKAA